MVGTALFRLEAPRQGAIKWKAVGLRFDVVRSIRVSLPRKASSRISIRYTLSARRARAFIKSQAGEGWRLVKTAYDDGGLSGGTMERPALQRLLSDIDQGRIGIVVVYKIDRLTRSLTDFSRIVEIFDAHHVSFISPTQQFNTTSSMGRLTLNILLSFAQFEREVTGERIRDKVAASKKKGMWLGGYCSLGYDLRDHQLVINPREAKPVRYLYKRYLELVAMRLVIAGEVSTPQTDWTLLKAVARGHEWFNELISGRASFARNIAAREGVSERFVRRLIPLAFHSPTIVEAIADGRQPVSLTAEALSRGMDIPGEWDKQFAALGFDRDRELARSHLSVAMPLHRKN